MPKLIKEHIDTLKLLTVILHYVGSFHYLAATFRTQSIIIVLLSAASFSSTVSYSQIAISSLKKQSSLREDVSGVQKLNEDSVLDSQLTYVYHSITGQLNDKINSAFTATQQDAAQYTDFKKISPITLSSLQSFHFENAVFTSEINQWQIENNNTYYVQNCVSMASPIKGIPVNIQVFGVGNYYNSTRTEKIGYKINYTKDNFLDKLQLNSLTEKSQLSQKMDFAHQVDYNALIQKNFSAIPGIPELIQTSGCSWKDLLEMPLNQFEAKFGKPSLESKTADARQLQNYYTEFSSKSHSDTNLSNRLQAANMKVDQVNNEVNTSKKLIRLKNEINKLLQQKKRLQVLYDEKVKRALEGVNVIDAVAKGNNLSRLQRIMLNVKRLDVGQHSITTGNLVLRNYLQNGVTVEVETDKFYVLITKGSQEKIGYSNGFFPIANSQNGINEYYQYNSRYKLSGLSFGKRNRSLDFQQISLMSFRKVDNLLYPSLIAKAVNVLTYGNQFNWRGSKLSYDLSKSFLSRDNSSAENAANNTYKTGNESFLETVAVNIKYEKAKNADFKQKVDLFYNSLMYNNPGLNGGNRPGLQLGYSFDKRIDRTKLSNQIAFYNFTYGNSTSLKSVRDRFSLSYKIKQYCVGVLVNGSYSNSAYESKNSGDSRTMDLLLTGQTNKRVGELYANLNCGIGYGVSTQEGFAKAKDYSFFVYNTLSYRSFSLDFNIDKFQTRNTEVFLKDSTALILTSNLNVSGMVGYNGIKGSIAQFGIQYKELSNLSRIYFLAGNFEFKLFKRLSLGGMLNLPIDSPSVSKIVNNTFSTKVIYNITTHGK